MTEELQEQSTANEAPEEMPDEELLYDLADLFKIFSDTTRIKILYALMGRELSVSDIAEATETAPATHPQAVAPREVQARRAQHQLLPRRRPRLHHAQPGHEPHLRVSSNSWEPRRGTRQKERGNHA